MIFRQRLSNYSFIISNCVMRDTYRILWVKNDVFTSEMKNMKIRYPDPSPTAQDDKMSNSKQYSLRTPRILR